MRGRSSRVYEKRFERTLPQDREDRIAGKVFDSLSHCNLAHKFVLMLKR